MILEIYKDFENLLMLNPPFIEFVWHRKFSSTGEFRLNTNFSSENFKLFDIGNILFRRDLNEAALVEGRDVIQTEESGTILVVRGRFLSSLLDRRVATISTTANLNTILTTIINDNFLTSAAITRRMSPLLTMLPFDISSKQVLVEHSLRSALDIIGELAEEHQFGFNCIYNIQNQSFDLQFYNPTYSDAVFSSEFNNVLEEMFHEETERMRNVIIIGDTIHNDNVYTGINRREMSTSGLRDEEIAATQAIQTALRQNRHERSINAVIDTHNIQFAYLNDWNLGSVVTLKNRDLDFIEKRIVSDIVEFYDRAGFNIEVQTTEVM
ncbi:MAG: siphovirus ReqiPepy6 Gp37-like family protein [Defluviitaleaceae bacterium]|nr:siphovirus ReqiPepy6 Gp37-like family protein [Defluviitaleaceae bacterium]